MLSSLFGKRNKEQTSIAPATTEKEDGGFVLLGDASAAAGSAGQATPAHLYPPPLYAAQPGQAATGGATAAGGGGGPAQQSGEAAHPLSWLHGVPFSLAPRYQLGRQGQQEPPSSVFVQLSQADESLKSYAYDFALERSVLCSS